MNSRRLAHPRLTLLLSTGVGHCLPVAGIYRAGREQGQRLRSPRGSRPKRKIFHDGTGRDATRQDWTRRDATRHDVTSGLRPSPIGDEMTETHGPYTLSAYCVDGQWRYRIIGPNLEYTSVLKFSGEAEALYAGRVYGAKALEEWR
jgi:hypothetical protein